MISLLLWDCEDLKSWVQHKAQQQMSLPPQTTLHIKLLAWNKILQPTFNKIKKKTTIEHSNLFIRIYKNLWPQVLEKLVEKVEKK